MTPGSVIAFTLVGQNVVKVALILKQKAFAPPRAFTRADQCALSRRNGKSAQAEAAIARPRYQVIYNLLC